MARARLLAAADQPGEGRSRPGRQDLRRGPHAGPGDSLAGCNNPTFQNGKNTLLATAPYPTKCDKLGSAALRLHDRGQRPAGRRQRPHHEQRRQRPGAEHRRRTTTASERRPTASNPGAGHPAGSDPAPATGCRAASRSTRSPAVRSRTRRRTARPSAARPTAVRTAARTSRRRPSTSHRGRTSAAVVRTRRRRHPRRRPRPAVPRAVPATTQGSGMTALDERPRTEVVDPAPEPRSRDPSRRRRPRAAPREPGAVAAVGWSVVLLAAILLGLRRVPVRVLLGAGSALAVDALQDVPQRAEAGRSRRPGRPTRARRSRSWTSRRSGSARTVVVEGTSGGDLTMGPGHRMDSALPGPGGHRGDLRPQRDLRRPVRPHHRPEARRHLPRHDRQRRGEVPRDRLRHRSAAQQRDRALDGRGRVASRHQPDRDRRAHLDAARPPGARHDPGLAPAARSPTRTPSCR